LAYGSLLPFGGFPGVSLYHGVRAHAYHYGYGRRPGYGSGYGYRGAGYVPPRMRRLARLIRDLNVLSIGYAAPPTDRQVLRNDLMSLVQGGVRPPTQPVIQVSQHLIEYLPRRRSSFLNTERLALDLEAVMNGGRIKSGAVGQAIGSAEGLLRTSGVPQPGVQAIAADLRAIGTRGPAGNQAALVR
jgi:hypothetical protein